MEQPPKTIVLQKCGASGDITNAGPEIQSHVDAVIFNVQLNVKLRLLKIKFQMAVVFKNETTIL